MLQWKRNICHREIIELQGTGQNNIKGHTDHLSVTPGTGWRDTLGYQIGTVLDRVMDLE
jgi:hypothetical protein